MASGGRVPNNSTSISLHERFSKLRSAAGGQRLAGKTQGARQNAALLQKASSINSRLAQQMARRNASVAAALKLKKKSIKQRLGASPSVSTNVRSRGTLKVNQRGVGNRGRGGRVATAKANRGSVKFIASQTITRGGRGAKTSTRGRVISPTKKAAAPVVATTYRSPAGRSPRARGALRGVRRGGRAQTSFTSNQVESPTKRGRGRGRGQRGGRGQSSQRGASPSKANSRGQSAGRGRGRGRGGNTKVSKEDLDKQLDQYMSKTRGALDQDLENYMSKIGDVEMS